MIDVLIPVYNAENTVDEAIASVLRQSYQDIRVIVVDDGSTDGTLGILKFWAAKDDRVKIVCKPNSGIVDALNLGLEQCTAEFVARLDGDDIAYPKRFAQQLAFLQSNIGHVAVGGNVWKIDRRGRRIGRTNYYGRPPAEWNAIPSIEPYIMHPFLMARCSALRGVGGYRHVYNAEDTDLYWRLREIGDLHNLDDILGEYRVHAGSVTSGSALSARIGAVTSQLSAISARRRSMGQEDIIFRREDVARYRAVVTMDGILALASEGLAEDERLYLGLSASAKFIELHAYRQFRIGPQDAASIFTRLAKGFWYISKRDRSILRRSVVLWLRPKLGIKRWWYRTFSGLAGAA